MFCANGTLDVNGLIGLYTYTRYNVFENEKVYQHVYIHVRLFLRVYIEYKQVQVIRNQHITSIIYVYSVH